MEVSRQKLVNTRFAVSPHERTQIAVNSVGNISEHLRNVIINGMSKIKELTPSQFSKKNRNINPFERKINPTTCGVNLPYQLWEALHNESIRLGVSKAILFHYIYPFKEN